MTNDQDRVKEIFLTAAELPDQAAQVAYLHQACDGDASLRMRVEALLRAHDSAGSFLGTPVVTPGAHATPTLALDASQGDTHGTDRDESEDLSFLAPSSRPDSL